MMASGVLFMVVVAVTAAVSTAQQSAFEVRQRTAASVAAEDLMGRLSAERYAQLAGWDGFVQSAGTMTDAGGLPFPDAYDTIGRDVTVSASSVEVPSLDFKVVGSDVTIRAFDAHGRVLAVVDRFVPEPQP